MNKQGYTKFPENTPGPWEVDVDTTRPWVYHIYRPAGIPITTSELEAQANGLLIQAAPRLVVESEDALSALLSAAGRMYEFCRCGNNGAGDCDSCQIERDLRLAAHDLREALSKARATACQISVSKKDGQAGGVSLRQTASAPAETSLPQSQRKDAQ